MNRSDFEILKNDLIYFDNAATTLKPNILIKKITEYYKEYSSNIHRGKYSIGKIAEHEYEETRKLVAQFINAKENEIIFTSGTTDSINKIVFGFFRDHLKSDDEVILTTKEHASLILPWYKLDVKIKFVDNIEDIIINEHTKVISLAHITNVTGELRDIKKITKFAHDNNIFVLLDAAQSLGHIKTDVKDLDVDFLCASAHKMCGPTGVGILYGKYNLLKETNPIILGGGMNKIFDDKSVIYASIPYLFEAGTPNIGGVISFKESIKYLNMIGLNRIYEHEVKLKEYFINNINDNYIIYNKNIDSGIISFNHKYYSCDSIASYLDSFNVCIRSGKHCSKLIPVSSCRISFYFYNTIDEVKKVIEILNNIA